MRPSIYSVIKDILIIAFFSALFYLLTHNPVIRPEPSFSRGIWSIELHQKPLVLGIAGHNYLVLRDGKSQILSTLHGLPSDKITGQWKYVGRTKNDILRVWEFGETAEKNMRAESYGISLIKTNQEEALARWELARACGKMIDELSIPYPPFGVSLRKDTENSNSVAYTLASCMNLETSHVGLFTPGWGNNLISE